MKLSFVLSLSIILSSDLMAQESLELNSIIIRGTKENKEYNETTSSITAIKGEELKDLTLNNNLDALNGLSNVQVNQVRGGGETFSIRGINNTGVTGFQKDSLASLIIDDVFQSDLAIRSGSLDFWDMESLEIHRGGQATTQGINSLAGTILMSHKDPSFFPEGQLKFGYGSFNRREVGVTTNHEIIPGKVAARVSFNKDMTDGHITNIKTGNDKWGKKDKNAGRGSLLYQINDTDKLVFDFKYSHLTNGGTYVQGEDPFKHEVSEDYDYNRKSHNTQASFRYYKQLNDSLQNTAIVAYSRSKSSATSDADGTSDVGASKELGMRVEKYDDKMITFENLLNYKAGKINNTLGFNFHRYQLNDYHRFNLKYASPHAPTFWAVIDATQAQENTKHIYSLFDSLTYDFNESHSLNVGVRLELAQNEYVTFLDGTVIGQSDVPSGDIAKGYLNAIRGSHGDKKSKLMSLPKIGYVYHLNNQNDFGLSFSQAYRNGGVSVNRSKGTTKSYDPEFTNNYEISHKFNNNKFRVSSNIFYIDWRKQQVQVQLRTGDPYYTEIQNSSSSRLYGAEIQSQYKLTNSQTVGANMGVVRTKFKKFVAKNNDYSGNEFPDAPKYTALLNWSTKWTDSLSSNLIGRFLGKSYSNAENTKRVDEQFYLDATIGYVFSSYELELYGKNLLDKDYLTYDGRGNSAFAGIYHQTSTPREFGVRFNYYW